MPHINVKIEDELHEALNRYMLDHNLTLSAALRDLLRRALGTTTSSHEAGWLEGYNAAFLALRKAVVDVAAQLKPKLPGASSTKKRRSPRG